MDWEFDRALDGNIALTGEIELAQHREFTLALAFGDGLQSAVAKLFQGLGIPFAQQCQRFVEQWQRADQSRLPLERHRAIKAICTRQVIVCSWHRGQDLPGCACRLALDSLGASER